MRVFVRAVWSGMALGGVVFAGVSSASAQDIRLRVNTFPGPQNLALFVA
jgi:hypothetical protein